MRIIWTRAIGALYLLVATSAFSFAQGGGCVCTNCPQFMPDNFIGDFLINVQNASNPTLGQNGQGVCGVVLNFDHEYLGDLSITLTSPAGQTVTLVGPVGFFGGTDFTTWNVTFVPCGDAANPDPGFSSTWNNNQPWGTFGMYSGSYYPYNGCLENFNTGPVDGTWTLTVADMQAVDVGNFYDYEIIFCDPGGINCFSCAAWAGNLLQGDVNACEGAPALSLNLPPTFTTQQPEPPAPDYSYTYIIGGPGGVIQEYQAMPDLTSYPAGAYTVCGLSYLTSQENLIPPPDGSLTVTQLASQLNSTSPPFCGNITVNCVNVNIFAAPPDEEEYAEICAPECYFFHGTNYCQSGTYVKNLVSPQGCPYVGTLYLTVKPVAIKNVIETICENTCATTPGFESACSAGQYTETFVAANGCDSIVHLNLIVTPVIAVIGTPPTLSCDLTPVLLSGVGSTIGAGVSYLWTASNGGNIVGNPNVMNTLVNAAGDYTLLVCKNSGGVMCCDSTMVSVDININVPPTPGAISGNATPCLDSSLVFSIAPITGTTSYTWTVPPGVQISSGQGSANLTVVWDSLVSGNVCVRANNNCGTGDSTCLNITPIQAPPSGLASGDTLLCVNETAIYSTPLSAGADGYNWSVVGPGLVISGQNSDSVTVQWTGPGAGSVCVQPYNTCGLAQSNCVSVTVESIPQPPVINGAAGACNDSTTLFTTPIAGVTYNWQVTGGTVLSGAGTDSLQVKWNSLDTIGTVCLQAGNFCGLSPATCLTVALTPPPATPQISGTDTLCAGATGIYTVNLVNGATGYGWTVSAEGIILSGQNTDSLTVQWITPGIGTVGVVALGNCGSGSPAAFSTAVLPAPLANAGSDNAVCGQNFQMAASISQSGYNGLWQQLAGPGTAVFSDPNAFNSAVQVDLNGTYTFSWTESNGFCGDSDTVLVAFNAIPLTGAVTVLCDAANEFFTVSFPVTGTEPFTIPGGTTTTGLFTSTPLATGSSYSFSITDANGCTTTAVSGAHSCICTSAAGTMAGNTLTACGNNTVSAQYNNDAGPDGNDVTGYILHDAPDATLGTVFAQNSSGVFSIQPGMQFGVTYYISAVTGNLVNGLPDLADPCLAIAPGQPVVFNSFPVPLAGPDSGVCDIQVTLGAQPASGTWSAASGPGTLIFNNPSAGNSIATVDQAGSYTAIWTADNSGCIASDTIELDFYPLPQLVDIQRQCDSANEYFTVTLTIGNGTLPYSVNGIPATGNVFVSTPYINGASYTFSVTDVNGCMVPDIAGAFACNCATSAGTMGAQTLEACIGTTVTAVSNGDGNTDGNDVTAFILHTGAGASAGQIIAQNTTGTFGFLPGMTAGQTYYISLVVGNPVNGMPDPADPCFAVAAGQPVVFRQIPVPNAGADQSVCGEIATLSALTTSFSGVWEQTSGPGTAVLATPQNAGTGVQVAVSGVFGFRRLETNSICSAADTVLIEFNPIPFVNTIDETCNGTSTAFTVEAHVGSGTPPFTISGLNGVVNADIFTSELLPSGSIYSFTVTDAKGCTTEVLNGIHICNCITDAGTMDLTPAVFCAGDAASAVWNNDGSMDADDQIRFILHDQPGPVAGTIYAISNSPVFNLAPPLQTGVTYYISAIAGSSVAGVINPNDPCLSVSPGTPVRWKDLPQAGISGDATICNGDITVISFNGNGDFPLSLQYFDPAGNPQTLQLPSAAAIPITINPTTTGTFTLTGVTDGSLPNCNVALSESVTITVNQPLSAGSAVSAPEYCAGSNIQLQLGSLLSGADSGGNWVEISGTPSTGNAFNAVAGTFSVNAQVAGTYKFRYAHDAAAPCPDEHTDVEVILHPLPVANAGQDFTLDCNHLNATIGGNSSIGTDIVYSWLFNGTPVPSSNTALIDVTEGGSYTLLVTNGFGCTASDAVTVNADISVPVAEIASNNIICYGDANGSILIQNVTGGTPPVFTALNDGPYSNQTLYTNLPKGKYIIHLQDAIGCEWISDTLEIKEPAELTASLGPDLKIALGEAANVKLTVSVPVAGLDTIIWTPLLDTLSAGKDVQHISPYKSQQLKVTVYDTSGCRAQDDLYLIVDRTPHVYVPNIFKPEQINLTVYGGIDVERIEVFRIYDRWGDLMFESLDFEPDDLAAGWSGKFRGRDVAPGVYAWTLQVRFIDGTRSLLYGDVTIIR